VQFFIDCKVNGVDLPATEGYSMVSEEFDPAAQQQIYDLYQNGFRDATYDKPCVFDPRLVNLRLGIGNHWGYLENDDRFLLATFDPLFLLHYKYMGRERFVRRRRIIDERMSETNKVNNWGIPKYEAAENFKLALDMAHKIVN